MSRPNRLPKQTGEYLVAAELGRRGIGAATFSENISGCDILALRADASRVLVKVRAKTASHLGWYCGDWPEFVQIAVEAGVERSVGQRTAQPDCFWAFVAVGEEHSQDEFYIISDAQLVDLVRRVGDEWVAAKPGRRLSINPTVMEARHLSPFQDNWSCIEATA
jgi:hypothetical protein